LDPEGNERRALEQAACVRGARVVEIGCGDGRSIFRYAAEAASVVGIDPLQENVAAVVRQRPPALGGRVSPVRADAAALPLRSTAFDVALFAWSL
jgi:ubiquinone/menaquinone biosynthesis C-methylase UbiE